MLHFVPEFAPDFEPTLHPEPVTRLASVRNALRTVDEFGGGPASDFDCDEEISSGWAAAGEAAKRCFDRRSAELVALASDGLELVSARQELGQPVSPAAMRVIAEELRSGLEGLQRLVR